MKFKLNNGLEIPCIGFGTGLEPFGAQETDGASAYS